MKKINILTTEMANKIAAGEVVERPASVIKELVENSVDAGATSLIIEIKNGGISYIRVTDNGCGISPEDIKTAFLPHATSKIVDENDLFSIKTLGFRGEALASIAAVSNVEIMSKTEDENGTKLEISGEDTLYWITDENTYDYTRVPQELIDKIEVYEVEGTGLNRTQSVVIHYRFIGELDMPENFDKIKVNTRKGVEVEYLTSTKTE